MNLQAQQGDIVGLSPAAGTNGDLHALPDSGPDLLPRKPPGPWGGDILDTRGIEALTHGRHARQGHIQPA